jgi:hypothetical protein
MRLALIGTAAAAALALAVPAVAGADTWTVDPAGGPCNDAPNERRCPTIQAAAASGKAAAGDEIEVLPKADGWNDPVTFAQGGLTVRRAGTGVVRITRTLTFTGSGTGAQTFTIQGLTILPTSGSALAFTTDAVTGAKTVNVQSSILSGSGSAAAITAGTAVSLSPISITARHVTIGDSGSAPAVAETQNGGAITTTFHDSIVQGTTADGVNDSNNDAAPNSAALFANPAAEDFHLRVGSPAINAGGGQGGGESATDIDGEARSGAWDRGGDEFVNHAPSKPGVALLSPNPQQRGSTFNFGAAATDPDTALQDAVNGYEWTFGDGSVEMRPGGDQSFHSHVYAAAGTYQVTVRAIDRAGDFGPVSDPLAVTVTDPPPAPAPGGGDSGNTPVGPGGAGLPGINPSATPSGPDTAPPLVAITFPAHNQAVKLGRNPRAATPMLRGGNADESGVRRVELALVRRDGARCRWYDGRGRFVPGACAAVRWFRGTVDDFAWRHVFPRGFRPSLGTHTLFVRAVDYLGNTSSTFSAPARTAISFRYVR